MTESLRESGDELAADAAAMARAPEAAPAGGGRYGLLDVLSLSRMVPLPL